MMKANTRLHRAGVLITIVAVTICVGAIGVIGSAKQAPNEVEPRADIIPIDSMRVFGQLERPPPPGNKLSNTVPGWLYRSG